MKVHHKSSAFTKTHNRSVKQKETQQFLSSVKHPLYGCRIRPLHTEASALQYIVIAMHFASEASKHAKLTGGEPNMQAHVF